MTCLTTVDDLGGSTGGSPTTKSRGGEPTRFVYAEVHIVALQIVSNLYTDRQLCHTSREIPGGAGQ